jgi:hypothetical protein
MRENVNEMFNNSGTCRFVYTEHDSSVTLSFLQFSGTRKTSSLLTEYVAECFKN